MATTTIQAKAVPSARRAGAEGRVSTYAAYGLTFLVLCYVAYLLASGAALDERVRLLRYWSLLGSAAFAVAVPHVLLPDPRVPLMQLVNAPPGRLQGLQLQTWAAVPGAFLVPAVILALYDPGGFGQDLPVKAWHLAESLLVLAGISVYAFAYYVSIGPRSQAWQEGRAGGWYQGLTRHSTQASLGVPPGLVPAITATARIFTLAILVVVAGGYASQGLGPAAAWVPAALFGLWAGVKLARQRGRYDRHFYHTSAFYREVFSSDHSAYGGGQVPITYDAAYWVPLRYRPHVWAGLRQLDRRLPLGRLMALGHGLLWLLFLQGASAAVIAAYLVLFIAAKNAACYLLAARALAPPGFQLALQSPRGWTLTRFFVNLRWTLPLLLSLLLVAFFSATFTYTEALAWTALDIGVAFVFAALVTYAAEGRHRKRYD